MDTGERLRLYNTLSREKEGFVPLDPEQKLVKMYTCGPTVYRYAHIGNLRSYLMADLLRRVLRYNGYEAIQVKNITDVGHMREEVLDRGEDKVLLTARLENKSPWEIADFYTRAFLQDEVALNILPAMVFPRATDHIQEMIYLIQRLLEKGFAYETDGTIYYDVSKFEDYGKLSGNRLDQMRAGYRVHVEENKRDPEDFALWKKAEPGRLIKWDSPWGWGFPGWHIECSAMSMKYLGEQFDIHTGGIDNIFPHHEDEIAQSEAATGKQFVRYWLHGEHLLVDGVRMAKSAGNFYTIRDLMDKGFNPLAFRYLNFTAHYRSKLNFTWDSLAAAQHALERLYEHMAEWDDPGMGCAEYQLRFQEALNDELDTPVALSIMWEVVHSDLPASSKAALLLDFDRVFGLDLDAVRRRLRELPEGASQIIEEREDARRRKDWARADTLRVRLKEMGVEVQDTPQGPRWRRLKAASLR